MSYFLQTSQGKLYRYQGAASAAPGEKDENLHTIHNKKKSITWLANVTRERMQKIKWHVSSDARKGN